MVCAPKLMRRVFDKETHLQEIVNTCREFKLNEEITLEMVFNTGYSLGRRRWFWGPLWRYEIQEWMRRLTLKRKPVKEPPETATNV